jgi:hypothetical protein
MPEPAAHHDPLRIQDGDEVGEAEADPPAELFHDTQGLRVPRRRRRRHVLSGDELGVSARQAHRLVQRAGERGFPREARQSPSGRVPLPATSLPARARRTIGVDHHVAHLPGEPSGARVHPAADDQCAADPGPQSDDEPVARPAGRPEEQLRQPGAVGVVVGVHRRHPERLADPLGHEIADGDTARRREVRGESQHPPGIDQTGDADPCGHRSGSRAPRVAHVSLELEQHRADRIGHSLAWVRSSGGCRAARTAVTGGRPRSLRRGLHPALRQHGAARADGHPQDLRPPDVHPVGHQAVGGIGHGLILRRTRRAPSAPEAPSR